MNRRRRPSPALSLDQCRERRASASAASGARHGSRIGPAARRTRSSHEACPLEALAHSLLLTVCQLGIYSCFGQTSQKFIQAPALLVGSAAQPLDELVRRSP